VADHIILYVLGACALVFLLRKAWVRLQLSRAKHRSLAGHARMARRFAGLVPYYEYGEDRVFRVDGAPEGIAAARRAGIHAARRRRSPGAARRMRR
jgi:glutamate-1-semialdehyde 2,1-aminomutase